MADSPYQALRRLAPTVDEMHIMLTHIGGYDRESFQDAVVAIEEQRTRLATSEPVEGQVRDA